MLPINLIILGASAMASAAIALFFLRFWKNTNDRFFLFFAASFLIEACERILMGSPERITADSPVFYLIRLVTYLLIIVAILDKNFRRNKK
ncbi:MAG: DUF5985 family protein [Gallionella sp.]